MSGYGWQSKAACHGQPIELFYGPDSETAVARAEREQKAKAFCWNPPCPVRRTCLQDALNRGTRGGVWGGLNDDERSTERRRRQRRAGAA